MKPHLVFTAILALAQLALPLAAQESRAGIELHVAPRGSDAQAGTASEPLPQAAARRTSAKDARQCGLSFEIPPDFRAVPRPIGLYESSRTRPSCTTDTTSSSF